MLLNKLEQKFTTAENNKLVISIIFLRTLHPSLLTLVILPWVGAEGRKQTHRAMHSYRTYPWSCNANWCLAEG